MPNDERLRSLLTDTPADVPPFAPDLDEVLGRARARRHRRVLAGGFVVTILAVGVGLPLLLLSPLSGRSPSLGGKLTKSPSVMRSPTSQPSVSVAPIRSLGKPRIISSSSGRLVVEWPNGLVRWTVDAYCGIGGKLLSGQGAGSIGGGCAGHPYFGYGSGGLGFVHNHFYAVAGGWVFPRGVWVRVILRDGSSVDALQSDGLWLVVVANGSPSRGPNTPSPFKAFEAVDGNGKVLQRAEILVPPK